VLEGRLGDRGLGSAELAQALDNCISCKACRTECPSNVDLALLKAELMHARHQADGIPIRDRMIAAADTIGRLGSAVPRLANIVVGLRMAGRPVGALLGLDPDRPIPRFATWRFDRWFARRPAPRSTARGRVVLWDDTWVRYHEPHVGSAAVRVLDAAGFDVVLPIGRRCCGRPAVSRGLLDEARRLGEHNVALLRKLDPESPIVFLEPSCYSMFVDECRQFRIPGADEVAERCVLFEDLILDTLRSIPEALALHGDGLVRVAIHGHCHAKTFGDPGRLPPLAERIPGVEATLLATGCCGMAGAFGMMRGTQELSRAVAEPLVGLIRDLPDGTRLVASGMSCRHQIRHLTDAEPIHMAELLAAALADDI
jgi:Fe-S oxidoreductase